MTRSIAHLLSNGISDKTDNPAVVAESINLVYRSDAQTVQTLKQISLSIPKGSVQMIMGPAGAGKTTLLMVLAGLLLPTSGRVELLGQNLAAMSCRQLTAFRLHHIGILFQEENFLAALNARENIEVMLCMKGLHGKAVRTESLALLNEVGLGDHTEHLPKQLSGGQQLRLGIARSLAGVPDILIADEPTSALDAENGCKVVALMHRLAKERNCTVIIATDDERIAIFADRIAYLEDGQLKKS
jgi:putative ABC transport system ATP-binding protein